MGLPLVSFFSKAFVGFFHILDLMAKLLVLIVAFFCALSSACGIPQLKNDFPLGVMARKCPQGELSRVERQERETHLSERYGVKIAAAETPCRNSSVSCQAIEPGQGQTLALLYELIDGAFSRYPEGFLREFGPHQVFLVNDLYSASRTDDVAGFAFYTSRVIYLSIPALCSDESFRHTIQHEIFHVLDPQLIAAYEREAEWNALNPSGFSYVGHNVQATDRLAKRPVGFASSYGQVSQFEDRADIFALALVSPWSAEQKNLSNHDAYLSVKRRTLAQWMAELWPETKPLLNDISAY